MFGEDGLTGLWVADMDFKVADCITDAMHKMVDFGVFGYVYPWDGYYDAIIEWEAKYHNYNVKKDWIRFAPGVVPAFNWAMLMLTQPGDSVMVMTPSYYPMLEAPVKNDRKLVTSDLVEVNGRYVVDYEDFEKKLVDEDCKVFLFCSPHNPVCRVWEREELEKILSICRKHHVYVVSDEIHQDIVFGGHEQIPSALVGDYSDLLITLIAPSKTFNVAGLQNATLIIEDEKLRALYDKFTAGIRVLYGNTMGYVAAEAAFKEGRPWLEQVLKIIDGNDKIVREILIPGIPGIDIPELEGTYLLWLDFHKALKKEEMSDFFEKKCRLAMDYGNWFNGDPCCVRMNLATSPEIIRTACETIVREYKKLRGE